jgi:hypothetical protein
MTAMDVRRLGFLALLAASGCCCHSRDACKARWQTACLNRYHGGHEGYGQFYETGCRVDGCQNHRGYATGGYHEPTVAMPAAPREEPVVQPEPEQLPPPIPAEDATAAESADEAEMTDVAPEPPAETAPVDQAFPQAPQVPPPNAELLDEPL